MKNYFDDLEENSSSSSSLSRVATLQNSGATDAPSEFYSPTKTSVPGMGGIKLPSWLNTDPDVHMRELIKTYKGIPDAFDPTDQVKAREDSAAYNISAGGQAANNAATEYVNRANQAGGSTLGAGVVKAQAMMPVLMANSGLKSEAADIAAKAHQEAASLAAQVSATISNARTSYLSMLAGVTEGQQKLQLQNSQFNAGMGLDAWKANQGVISDRLNRQEQTREFDITSKKQESDLALRAALGIQNSPGPSESYTLDNFGKPTSNIEGFNRTKSWLDAKNAAQQRLVGYL